MSSPKEYTLSALLQEHSVKPRSVSEVKVFLESLFGLHGADDQQPLLELLLEDREYRVSELGILMQSALHLVFKMSEEAILAIGARELDQDLEEAYCTEWVEYADAFLSEYEVWVNKLFSRKVFSERQLSEVVEMMPGLELDTYRRLDPSVVIARVDTFVKKNGMYSMLDRYAEKKIQELGLRKAIFFNEQQLIHQYAFEVLLFLGFYREKILPKLISQLSNENDYQQKLVQIKDLIKYIKQTYFK